MNHLELMHPRAFLPYKIENRENAAELSKAKIEVLFKKANIVEQELILQDLLLAGEKMETSEQRNMTVLAAEFFVKTEPGARRDFLLHVMQQEVIFNNLIISLKANHIFHQYISTGFTSEELDTEAFYAQRYDKRV